MAVASVAIALASGVAYVPGAPSWLGFTVPTGSIVAAVLAILALLRIRISEGRLCGRVWAWAGLVSGLAALVYMVGTLTHIFVSGD